MTSQLDDKMLNEMFQPLQLDEHSKLLQKVIENDIEGVQKALDEGVDIDNCPKNNYSLLMMAVEYDRPKIVALLLERGADTDLVGPQLETAMDIAKRRYDLSRRSGITSEVVACRDIYALLQKHQAKTARDLGIMTVNVEKILENQEKAALNALCLVARLGTKAKLLHYIDKEMKGDLDSTSIHWLKEEALANDVPSIIQVLKEKAVDLNEEDNQGNTLLHLATKQGKEKVVSALLLAGVDTTIENGQGQTALDTVLSENNLQILPVFLKKEELTPSQVQSMVHESINRGHVQMLEMILKTRKKDVDLKEAFLYTLQDKSDLYYRGDKLDTTNALKNQEKMASLILNQGLNAKGLETKEGIPVLRACVKNPRFKSLVPALIEKGADIASMADEQENSPLMMAVSYHVDDLALRLIKEGHDVNAINNKKASVLVVAGEVGASSQVVNALVEAGADVGYEVPSTHKNALTVAAENGHFATVQALVPLYPELKEEGINGLSHVERALSHVALDAKECAEQRQFFDRVRGDIASQKKALDMAERRERLEKRKANFRRTWGKIRAFFKPNEL